ncbi:MAG: endolytic transglycosylase MltG [Oscillospiraceae bacterium]|nr:endolytic transglycosylase MltG [Oscillospiraceae bacterium]
MDNNELYDESIPQEEQDLASTQELASISDAPQDFGENSDSIMPRDRFTDLNSVDENTEKTRLMDSVQPEEDIPEDDDYEHIDRPVNPVKKRRKKKKSKKKQTNHIRTYGQIFVGVLLAVVAIGVGAFLATKLIVAMQDFTGMAKATKEYEIVITDDMNTDMIAQELHENGIIEMPSLFKMYLKIAKEETGFLNGDYIVKSNMSYDILVKTLKTKKTYTETVMVMIPEGSTAQEIGQLLEANYVCRAEDFELFYKTKQEKFDFEEGIPDDPNRFYMLEGYLFPDTYEFYVIDDLKENPDFDTLPYAEQAATKMYKNFESKITRNMKYRMKELGLTLDQTIILASLIQWEGTNEDNMTMVSSVFHNRLNNMGTFPSLQSDTTYTYIDECIKPMIPDSAGDLFDDIIAAYDSYQCEGIPVGAICSPGLEAINAALYPAESDYYYFLASSDGVFYYAQTVEQHEQNIIDAELRSTEE